MLLSLMAKCERFVLVLLMAELAVSISEAAWIDRTDSGGIVTASSQIHAGESKEMAFDNSTSTKWLTNYTPTGWIQFQFPNANQYLITKYSIASANDAPDCDPRDWTLSGSNDGVNWDVVDTQVSQSWSERFQRREFFCANPNIYNYYRLDMTANNGSFNLIGFSEMELLQNIYTAGNPSPVDTAEGVANNDLTLSWEAPSGIPRLPGQFSYTGSNGRPFCAEIGTAGNHLSRRYTGFIYYLLLAWTATRN